MTDLSIFLVVNIYLKNVFILYFIIIRYLSELRNLKQTHHSISKSFSHEIGIAFSAHNFIFVMNFVAGSGVPQGSHLDPNLIYYLLLTVSIFEGLYCLSSPELRNFEMLFYVIIGYIL